MPLQKQLKVLVVLKCYTRSTKTKAGQGVVWPAVINPQFEQSLARAIDKLIAAGLRANVSRSHHQSSSIRETCYGFQISLRQIDSFGKRHRHRDQQARLYHLLRERVLKRFTLKVQLLLQMWGQGVRQHLNNERVLIKSSLIREIKKITDLLADPYCELFPPLTVDHDLIEVNNGCCWSIKRPDFVNGAIQDHQIGKVLHKAFSLWRNERSWPKIFLETILTRGGTQLTT